MNTANSLFKGNLWIWALGWLFHVSLALVLLRHLRYLQEPVWQPVVLVQPWGTYAGFLMVAALGGLWLTRRNLTLAGADWLAAVPPGLSAEVLLARPDVVQAEQALRAANANIGVARAAMFPRITLSGSAGEVSDSLAGVFSAGHFAYTITGSALVTLFDAGRNQANVRVSEINRDQAVASYEKAVQTAYREAADALVAQDAWRRQVSAQQALLTAEQDRLRLTRLKHEAGAASLGDLLDAERSLASVQQALVQVRLAEWLNRLSLYKALGGGEFAA